MNAGEISKAKRIRNGLIITSVALFIVAGLALFYPSRDPLIARCFSAGSCLLAAMLWLLPATKLSFARCLEMLVAGNVLLLWAHTDSNRLHWRWSIIHDAVGQLNAVQPFDFDRFGSLLSETLRGGALFNLGLAAVWMLNIFALIYLAQSEKEKAAGKAPGVAS
jgi:hypothetical protein